MAVNRTWFDKASNTKKEDVTFVDVTLWARQAELANEHLRKGSSVMIEGRLQLETWDDKASGQKRSKLKVVAEEMVFLGSKNAGRDSGNNSNRETESRPRTETVSAPAGDDFFPNQPDEVPF